MCEQLWRIIECENDAESRIAAIQAFAQLDARGLCQRIRESQISDTWVLNGLINSVPASVARSERLIDLLPERWQDFARAEIRESVSHEELAGQRAILVDQSEPAEDRLESIEFCGAMRDRGAVASLLEIVRNRSEPAQLREQALDSLGAIGGREAIDELICVVCGERGVSEEGMLMATSVLHHTESGRNALDPYGRDRLLRRLAAIDPAAPCVPFVLSASEGYPIREGAACRTSSRM